MGNSSKKWWVIFGIVVVAIALVLVGFGCKKRDAKTITPDDATVPKETLMPYQKPADASPITGLSCANYDKRPFAVMYSGDVETRPYFSNITKADMVVEMPHRAIHDGTRVMGIFGCNAPDQIGPMRSARVDFMNVANSVNAVFVLWGGDSVTKNLLNGNVMDSLTCADGGPAAGGNSCYRKSATEVPLDLEDRAFTSMPELISAAAARGYSNTNTFAGFHHQGDAPTSARPAYGKLTIGFDKPFRVHYEYNPQTNSYDRIFNNKEEVDFVTKERVSPKNVIVIETKKDAFYTDTDYAGKGLRDPWNGVDDTHRQNDNGQYPNFQLGDPWFDEKREGEAKFYMNGKEIIGSWKKDKGDKQPFAFYDAGGQEIHFVPGQIWLEVVASGKVVKWEEGTEEDRAAEKAEREKEASKPKSEKPAASGN